MPAQIVFLTLFLGLASGTQPVALEVTGPVKSVRLFLGGRPVAVMTQPPWRTFVELGPELTPRELTAVGFDAKDEEIARVSQTLNLPRPTAEFDIMVKGSEASLRWRHLINRAPSAATMSFDDKPLLLDARFRAVLPKFDREKPHVIAAEMRFPDGFVTRRELVLEGILSASTGTQLTPILLRETGAPPKTWDGCIARADGTPVRVAAVENPRGLVITVRDPFPGETPSGLDVSLASLRQRPGWSGLRNSTAFDRATNMRVLWAVSQRFRGTDATAELFEATVDFDASMGGALFMLYTEYTGKYTNDVPRQFADAVAVAGLRAVTGSWRRAVVFVLSATEDASTNSPVAVRRYFQTLGVPLFIWSRSGPRPDLAESWGAVDDISTFSGLTAAVARVRRTLEAQRIAWVDVDPLEALHLKASERCGIETVAQR
jgi:hypothetical protein